jgi:hypothetical protein
MTFEGSRILPQMLLATGLFLSFVMTGANAEEVKRKFGQEITVYKTASCGCCNGWVDYLRTQGFKVKRQDVEDLDQIKAQHGLTDPQLKSCHTAIVDGYVVEGHVPANDIWRLLSERPEIVGISAPGMPPMSPGMNDVEPKGYDVLSFDAQGATGVYSHY